MTKSVESENKILNWICDCCDLEFQERLGTVIDVFTNNNSNKLNSICPYCNKKIPKPNETLSYVKPYLNNEWVKELNGDIDTFFYDSNALTNWICRKCHRSFKAKISERHENDQCCQHITHGGNALYVLENISKLLRKNFTEKILVHIVEIKEY